jgi:hypothetical protein
MIDLWIRGKPTDPTHKRERPKHERLHIRESVMQKDTIEDDALVNELYNEAELLCIFDA